MLHTANMSSSVGEVNMRMFRIANIHSSVGEKFRMGNLSCTRS